MDAKSPLAATSAAGGPGILAKARRVAINPQHIVALEEYDNDVVCVVTTVKTYCTRRDKIRMEVHYNAPTLVVEL